MGNQGQTTVCQFPTAPDFPLSSASPEKPWTVPGFVLLPLVLVL